MLDYSTIKLLNSRGYRAKSDKTLRYYSLSSLIEEVRNIEKSYAEEIRKNDVANLRIKRFYKYFESREDLDTFDKIMDIDEVKESDIVNGQNMG